jgi:hypothetical protein
VLRESWSISLTATAMATTTIICRPVQLFSPALSLRLSPNPCSTPALDSLSVLYGHSDLFPYMITIFSYSFFFLICFCFLGDFFGSNRIQMGRRIMWVEWPRISRLMVGEGAERKSTTADLAAITWTAGRPGRSRQPSEKEALPPTHTTANLRTRSVWSSHTSFTRFFFYISI